MECSKRNFHLQSPNLGIAIRQISTIASLFLHLILVPSVTPVSFTFNSFNLSNPDMEYEGDAFPSKGLIQLTKNQAYSSLNNCSGRAIYRDPVRLWDRATRRLTDFTTQFTFSVDGLNHGDGLAFFLAANKSLPSNSMGKWLGLMNSYNNTIQDPFVAVEFDNFQNSWDPYDDHIGIDISSVESVQIARWFCESNESNKAVVNYNSRTKNLSVFLRYGDRPNSYSSISHLVDLRDYLPEWVTVGFSASTGDSDQIHSVHCWDFRSTLETVESQRNGTVAESGRNGTIVESGRNETKKKTMWVVLVACVFGILLGGFGLIWFICWKKRSENNRRYNGPSRGELEQARNQEDSVLINKVQSRKQGNDDGEQIRHHETDEHGALEEPTTQITIPGPSAAASGNSSAFGGTTNEMRPIPQSTSPARDTMPPPACSGTRGNGFPKKFSYQELVDATNNFRDSIGEGGFGEVFKGSLGEQNLEVAIKKFSKRKRDRANQFDSEVKALGLLRHENLVELYGSCNEENELLLVYEFMPNGSLWDNLFKEKRLLAWKERYKIVLDLANGLLHLHEEGRSCTIHRDIKSCNVLLDVDFKAKLGDFGLARIVEEGEDPLTTYIAGTQGYLAPECKGRQRPSKESDVYSFGIVALEIGCGRKVHAPVDDQELAQWVRMLYGNAKILEAADPRLCKEFDENEMKCLLVVGLWCANPNPSDRPSIREAINKLLQKGPLPLLPQEMPNISGCGPSNDRPPVKVDGISSSGSKGFATAPSGHLN